MLSYFLKGRKHRKYTPLVTKTKKGKMMLLSKYAVSNGKKSRFIKKQEESRSLSSLGLK